MTALEESKLKHFTNLITEKFTVVNENIKRRIVNWNYFFFFQYKSTVGTDVYPIFQHIWVWIIKNICDNLISPNFTYVFSSEEKVLLSHESYIAFLIFVQSGRVVQRRPYHLQRCGRDSGSEDCPLPQALRRLPSAHLLRLQVM